MTTAISDTLRDDIEAKVKDLLRAVELDVDLETTVEDQRLYFNVSGADARYFLRNKEEILRSLALLLHAYREKAYPDDDIEIRFDANHQLLEREKEVRAMAFSAVDQLNGPGDEVLLEPLNPYERRLVHMALVERTEIETESVGDGHFKRLKVKHVGEGAVPENVSDF